MRRAHALAVVAGFFAFASAPLAVQALRRTGDGGAWENRRLAEAPARPGSLAEVASLPRRTEAWLRDHFGLRRAFVELNGWLRFAAFGESANPQLTFGKGGQLFFTSHDAADPYAMLFYLCRAGDDPALADRLAGELARVVDEVRARAPSVAYLMVPTKTVVDPEDLPGWMRARCAGGRPMADAVLERLAQARPDVAARVDYPYALLRGMGMGGEAPAFPRVNFHWSGAAPRAVAAEVAGTRFGRAALGPLPVLRRRPHADVQHMLPGVPLRFDDIVPDHAAAGVTASETLPGLEEIAAPLRVGRYTRRDGRGPRLLILSDSFGEGIGGWFPAWYGEVRQVSVTNAALLSPARRARLWEALFDEFRPDDVLLVVHDLGVAYSNGVLAGQLHPGSTTSSR